MLVAESGYGKTTLVEQWSSRDRLVVGWFRARRSAADVSVVARALVAAADEVLPGAGSRLLQRLAVTDDPEREATLLAEMLAEDLDAWPGSGWIVLDDYQHLAASTASEVFVETVVERSPVQLLVASRLRPSWVAPSDVLSGSVLEVPEIALAMTAEEALGVLRGARAELAPGLVALARGWPALVGIAGMTPDAPLPDAELPETLYDFFAEELYRVLDPTVRSGLAILAEMPLVDRELAATILGGERAREVCDEGLRLGILDERDGYLEFHPLLAMFLERRAGWNASTQAPEYLRTASTHYRGRGELDAAFDLTEKIGGPTDVDRLVSDSMAELLDRARLPTLELWVSRATNQARRNAIGACSHRLRSPCGRAAILPLRQFPSERAVERTSLLAYRAYMIGGKAAHVGSREEEALALFRRAENAAHDDEATKACKVGTIDSGNRS